MTAMQIISTSLISAIMAVVMIFGITRFVIAQPGGIVERTHFAHFAGHGHGWGKGRAGHDFRAVCSDKREQGLDTVIGLIESFVDFTPPQTSAWNELIAAVREGSAAVGEACTKLEESGNGDTAPEKLAQLETLLTTGVAIVGKVRPAFDAFYATLDDDQKQALNRLMDRRHH